MDTKDGVRWTCDYYQKIEKEYTIDTYESALNRYFSLQIKVYI